MVLVRDGADSMHVFASGGHSRVDRVSTPSGPGYVYRVVHGADPLGYDHHAPAAGLVDGLAHSARQWRTATCEARYPDFVGQIVEMFDHHRAGDLVVLAADGWHFDNGTKSSHGGIDASDMRVPLFFAGPGLPAGTEIGTARTVDVAPTILGLMGLEERIDRFGPMDGVNRAPELRRAR